MLKRIAWAATAAFFICGAASAQKISGLTELAAAPANGDLIEIVDVSDATMAATGTNKKITTANLMSYLATADAGGDTTTFCMLATAATGTLAPATDAGCSYNATTNVLTVSGSVAANVTGALTGNADTATALAANGANCSAGQAPLGVDASGAVESCTAYLGDPGTVVDNAIVAWDGTGGTAVQERAITIADVSGSSVTMAVSAGNALVVDVPEPAAANGASVAGKSAAITASDAVASLDTAGAAAGGDVTFTSGAAARNASGNADGGDFEFTAGAGIGSGVAGQIVGPVGTAASPGYVFSGDENTGVYWVGADNLGFSVGGAVKANASTSSWVFYQQITNGGSSPLKFVGFAPQVEAVTTTKTPTGGESCEHYTNTGDGDGASITLTNDPVEGMCLLVSLTVAQTVTVSPSSGETLYMGADQCVASMTASGIGASVTIRAATGGSGAQWHSFGPISWTCND